MNPINPEADLLVRVFGEGEGVTPQERARASSRLFVRGIDLLTFDDSPSAKGRRLTAREALEAYGFEKLAEVATEGAAVICDSVPAAGRVLRGRRADLGLEVRHIAAATGLRTEVVEALEASRRRPIQEYEKVARVLGLDERMLSFRSEPVGNQNVAVRMRALHDEKPTLSGTVVVGLAEAAWVAMTQMRLEAALQVPAPDLRFELDPFYGSATQPAFRVGYELAVGFRTRAGFDVEPIPSMRDLLERKLGIPLIQAELGDRIAGATVASDDRRAIVVNLSGRNRNVFARRNTLAHELCHILYDPRERLRDLRVDEYDDLDRPADQLPDPVEQRANAFAAELLAPQVVARRFYNDDRSNVLPRLIQNYGISFTAARYQTWNAIDRRTPIDELVSRETSPEMEWEGREAYTTTWHPIRSLADHPSRAGRFSALVIRAAETQIISWDTASVWLHSTATELQDPTLIQAVRELFPDVFDFPRL